MATACLEPFWFWTDGGCGAEKGAAEAAEAEAVGPAPAAVAPTAAGVAAAEAATACEKKGRDLFREFRDHCSRGFDGHDPLVGFRLCAG